MRFALTPSAASALAIARAREAVSWPLGLQQDSEGAMDPPLSENRRRRGSIGANTGTAGSELKKAASPARAAASPARSPLRSPRRAPTAEEAAAAERAARRASADRRAAARKAAEDFAQEDLDEAPTQPARTRP